MHASTPGNQWLSHATQLLELRPRPLITAPPLLAPPVRGTQVLRLNEATLRNIFTAVCTTGGLGEKAKHMSLEEWKACIRGLDLLAADFTERDATMCFACSRMIVRDCRVVTAWLCMRMPPDAVLHMHACAWARARVGRVHARA